MKLENLKRVEELQRSRSVLLGDLDSYTTVLNEDGKSRPYLTFYYAEGRSARNIILGADSETAAIFALAKSRTERLLVENAAALAALGVEV